MEMGVRADNRVMMKRRAISLVFAALALLGGSACGGGEPETVDTPEVTNPGQVRGGPGGIMNNVGKAQQSVQDSVNKVQEGYEQNLPPDY